MALQRLAIGVDDRERAHLIAGALGEVMLPAPVALSVFENADVWLVEALYTERPAADEFAIRIGQVLAIDPPACRVEEVAERNWVALSQAALPPVYAGRFTIFGSHDFDQVARGPNAIMVDAGEAFGTAHHATTYGCLLAIDQLVRRRRFKNVLDLGTGSGVLAIALCRALPKARILASDSDRRSIEVAIDNARRNHCMGHNSPTRLHFTHASGVSAASVRSFQPFDLIVANILAKPIVGLCTRHRCRVTQRQQSGSVRVVGRASSRHYCDLSLARLCRVLSRPDRELVDDHFRTPTGVISEI